MTVKNRMITHALISVGMIYFAKAVMHSLGNLLGFGVIERGMSGCLVTVFTVIGCVNACYMVMAFMGVWRFIHCYFY